MPLNDEDGEFTTSVEDDALYDGPHEIGAELAEEGVERDIEIDRGSGSYAENGPLEVSDHEQPGFSVGQHLDDDDDATEIGSLYPECGATEIGRAAEMIPTPFESARLEPLRIGSAAMYGPTEIGGYPDEGGSEIGSLYSDEGASEIGAAAVARVIEKARDNRQPPPVMRAVSVDEEPTDNDDWDLTETLVGAAEVTGNPDPFPLTTRLLLQAGAGTAPRIVRVDTQQSYKRFRAENSPEMAELAARVEEISQKLDAHVADPEAHEDLAEDVEDLVILGGEVQAAEAEKRVELWMPKRFDGLVDAWREGDFVCASIVLPGSDGEVRICTSIEPIVKCVEEMGRHAAEAGVHASTIVGVLPAMGCVLGAGTIIKEMASAAPSILQRPEASQSVPFEVRVEPKSNPALCALAALAAACRDGNSQACDEWQRLGALSPPVVKQAMFEALQLAKAAA